MKYLLLILPLLLCGLVAPTPVTGGLPVVIPEMALSFQTPEGWRISRESTAEQLLLYPGKSKTEPLLRVRAFHGNFSSKDLLPQMKALLGAEEKGVVFESREIWVDTGRRFETVTAIYRKGVQEWHARFTLAEQEDDLQHGFWFFGRKKELDRHWEEVKVAIATAAATRTTKRPEREERIARRTPDPDKESTPPEPEQTFIWQDVQSGLRITSWPVDFKPEEKSLTRLSKTGVVLLPTDSEAHQATRITLSRRNVGELVSAEGASNTLKEKLDAQGEANDVRQLNVRVATLPAALLRWDQEVDGKDLSYQVYFFKRGTALYRLDYSATRAWAKVRSRRDLLKDFVGGVSFD